MIAGLLDCLEQRYPGSKLLGFRDGPRGIVTKRYSEITVESMVRNRLSSPPFPTLPYPTLPFLAAAVQGSRRAPATS